MQVRISKYNPIFRNSSGAYQLTDEWTCPSEIGKTIDKKVFTVEDYLEIEEKYIYTIKEFLRVYDIKELIIDFFTIDLPNGTQLSQLSSNMQMFAEILKFNAQDDCHELNANSLEMLSEIEAYKGMKISVDKIGKYIAATLRNILGIKFTGINGTSIEFGWDYYVYLSTNKTIKYKDFKVPAGIFIESYNNE